MLELVQQKISKMIMELEHLTCEKKLRELWLFHLEKIQVGGLSTYTNTLRVQGRELQALWMWYPVMRERQWTQIETEQIPFRHKKTLISWMLRLVKCRDSLSKRFVGCPLLQTFRTWLGLLKGFYKLSRFITSYSTSAICCIGTRNKHLRKNVNFQKYGSLHIS